MSDEKLSSRVAIVERFKAAAAEGSGPRKTRLFPEKLVSIEEFKSEFSSGPTVIRRYSFPKEISDWTGPKITFWPIAEFTYIKR